MKNNNKGFTLIELLVVIAIIGLLSTLAVVSLNGARVKARNARRMSDLKQISTAMELYSSENSYYPINAGETLPGAAAALGACGTNGVGAVAETGAIDNLCGSGNAIRDASNVYLASIPIDPTNSGTNVYHFEADTSVAANIGSNYCMSAHLEGADAASDYFVCLNGSCFIRGTDCTEAGI